jgi:putative DNA primase/helicase
MMDPVEIFRSVIDAAGMTPPDEIKADGRLHRFSPTGKRRDDAGWYVLHLDNIPAGTFGDWRSGETQNWCAKSDGELSLAERQAIRERVKAAQRLRDRETVDRNASAAAKAADLWAAAIPAVAHPYLTAKAVKPFGLRIGKWPRWDRDTGEITMIDNVLMIPMRDTTGKLWSLQGINAEGNKLFLSGGKVKACYHSIGRPGGRLILGEGYATCATVHEATGDATAVAFNSGNLEPVALALRAKYPRLSIVIAADDDWKTTDMRTGEPTNPGLSCARAAAAAVGGSVAVPDFASLARGPKDTDFNDLMRLAGAMKIGGAA